MVSTSPAGDKVQLVADHVGATVAHLERRIDARFGERGLTKVARDLGQLVVLVESDAARSRDRLRRTTLAARVTGIVIVVATLVALAFSLRSAVVDGLARTFDWVPLVESVINDLVFAAIALVFRGPSPSAWSDACCCACSTGCAPSHTSSTCTSCRRIRSRSAPITRRRRRASRTAWT